MVRDGGEGQLTAELLGAVVVAVRPARPDGHGDSWELLVPQRERVRAWVKGGVTVTKIGELLAREGTGVPYRTLHRFAVECCGFTGGRTGVTVRVDDGEPGAELQVDFGDLGMIPDEGRRRLLRALVFTAVFSRYCFVYLTFSQTVEEVIAGCEEAWAFFGGVFKVIVPDNLKPVVVQALGHRVPGGTKRRVQRQPHPVEPDSGDPHGGPCSPNAMDSPFCAGSRLNGQSRSRLNAQSPGT